MLALIFLLAFIYGFLLESVGKYLGSLMGFKYSLYLIGPRIFGVPLLAIFGWAFVITISISITSYLYRGQKNSLSNIFKLSLLDGFLLTLLDFLFEPSAVRLGWWQYFSGPKFYGVPLMNILAWIIGVFLFSYLVRLGLKRLKKTYVVSKIKYVFSVTSYVAISIISIGFAVLFGLYIILAIAVVSWGAILFTNRKIRTRVIEYFHD